MALGSRLAKKLTDEFEPDNWWLILVITVIAAGLIAFVIAFIMISLKT